MIIDNVSSAGGQHCETTTIGVLLRHEGIDLSEPMRFGLGEGLGFVYWDAKNMDFPFLGGRTKPAAITRNLAARMGLRMRTEETASARKAWRNVAAAIDAGSPVGLQLDSYHLDYFTAKVHFGAHFVAMYGYDDTHAHLVDTAQQGGAVTTTLKSLELARNQRGPMTARNLSFTIAGSADRPKLCDVVGAAIRSNAHDFLNPPIANLGHRGIGKAAGQVPQWLTRSANPRQHLALAASLMERGGTGGALFRAMYRDFLAECCTIVDDDDLRRGYRMYREIAPLWTEVSRLIAAAGETADERHLDDAAAVLYDLADRERDAMQTLARIRARQVS